MASLRTANDLILEALANLGVLAAGQPIDPEDYSYVEEKIDAVFRKPLVGLQEVVLLTPEHPGKGLPHHIGFICADLGRCDRSIELVGLALARFKRPFEPGEWFT